MTHRHHLLLPLAATLAFTLAASGCAVSPEPLLDEELTISADDHLSRVVADQEPLPQLIDLYEAVARALKYNLDHEVELAEEAVRIAELESAHFSLLPTIVANSGYAARDSYNASSSLDVLTGVPSLAKTTSQEKAITTADIGFSWNILDFGLSYVRARQAADQVLVQTELRRKVRLRIIEDVRTAYYRAATAQRLLGRVGKVEKDAQEVERQVKSLSASRETSPITALTYEREIVEVERTLTELQRELVTAKAQLAALINVPPGAQYAVEVLDHGAAPRVPTIAIEDLVRSALVNRPELREVAYRQRINTNEARAALLELLPGIQLIAGANDDSNAFLANGNWINWGAKASLNVIKVFAYPARNGVIEQQDDVLDKRALALTMAVMTQIYVGRARLAIAGKELSAAAKYRDVQKRLLAQIRLESDAGRVARQTLVREELNTVVAEVKYDLAYAAAHSADGTLCASVGIDPIGGEIDRSLPVAELASMLRDFGFGSCAGQLARGRQYDVAAQ